MKSLLFTLASFTLLAQLVSGSWYVTKCANKMGNCRAKCKTEEKAAEPALGRCPREKTCCVPSGKKSDSASCAERLKTANATTTTGSQGSKSSTVHS